MKSQVPKQFLTLENKPLALWSFEKFQGAAELIVVAEAAYQSYFPSAEMALPGKRRQDSVWNGLQKATQEWVLIHDAARPLIKLEHIEAVLKGAERTGAAALACPLKFTIKEADEKSEVINTPDRSRYWEIQTPQVVRRDILLKGFAYAQSHNLTVTDDVSLAELIKVPVQLVPGCWTNIKVTTPEDLKIAHALI
jgi:2-C-methyl-D-erythritol 4-phosphate cytidylyltransferase